MALPVSLRLSNQGRAQLFTTLKAGVRFQGIIDPDGNDERDSILNSTALISELGFLVDLAASDRLHIQSGISFPVTYELAPEPIFESLWSNIHAGVSYDVGKNILFFKGNFGPASGASGDTYKFLWAAQAGIRLTFGKRAGANVQFIETSF